MVNVDLHATLLVEQHLLAPARSVQGRASTPRISDCQLALTAFVLDGLGLGAGSLAIIAVDRTGYIWGAPRLDIGLALTVLLSLAALHMGGFYARRLQNSLFGAGAVLPIATAAAGLFVLAAGTAHGVPSETILPWIFGWWVTATTGLLIARMTFMGLLTNWAASGRLSERVAIVGTGWAAQRAAQLLRHASAGTDIIGIFVDPTTPKSTATENEERAFGELAALARIGLIDRVVLALPLSEARRIAALTKLLQAFPVEIGIGLNDRDLPFSFRAGKKVGNLFVMAMLERPLDDRKRLLKTLEDKVLALAILGLICPLLFAIAIAIKLDSPGPVLFRQKRYGYGNQVFEILKFRSMRMECADPLGERPTARGDPRVTRIGKIIRRTSLDELPQFINVLLGQMSIVGPRPHAVLDRQFQDPGDDYGVRQRVKPGITGWAQVNGWRGAAGTVEQVRKRIEHDLYYIENWSLALDLTIIIRTITSAFRHGAF
jgi:Undecaprenyl-phosphate glucose phosphotransferase